MIYQKRRPQHLELNPVSQNVYLLKKRIKINTHTNSIPKKQKIKLETLKKKDWNFEYKSTHTHLFPHRDGNAAATGLGALDAMDPP